MGIEVFAQLMTLGRLPCYPTGTCCALKATWGITRKVMSKETFPIIPLPMAAQQRLHLHRNNPSFPIQRLIWIMKLVKNEVFQLV
jgi:hypothetical protein